MCNRVQFKYVAMDDRFSSTFFTRKSRSKKSNDCDIYVRITANGKRSEMSINRKVDPERWNKRSSRVMGRNVDADMLNTYMDMITTKLNKIHQRLKDDEQYMTSARIMKEFNSGGKPSKLVLEEFKKHNEEIDLLIGRGISKSTAKRYWTCYYHINQFITDVFKEKDFRFRDIDYEFIKKFELFLKTVRLCNHNSSLKYINNFKKIIRIALANQWMDRDPFYNYKVQFEAVEREYLNAEEIDFLYNKELHFDRLKVVRDMFVFSCYTGLAYSDVEKLSKSDISIGIDGKQWINIRRTKTNTRSSIPLLPIAKEILSRYAYDPQVIKSERLIPVFSNQKSNAYLKEIAMLCGITKPLTTHLARHTFATTVTLTNGVPIETVSKMLGHKSLRTTQHYAKIVDRKVSDDMKILEEKLAIEKKNRYRLNAKDS